MSSPPQTRGRLIASMVDSAQGSAIPILLFRTGSDSPAIRQHSILKYRDVRSVTQLTRRNSLAVESITSHKPCMRASTRRMAFFRRRGTLSAQHYRRKPCVSAFSGKRSVRRRHSAGRADAQQRGAKAQNGLEIDLRCKVRQGGTSLRGSVVSFVAPTTPHWSVRPASAAARDPRGNRIRAVAGDCVLWRHPWR
jgi:hypothetical protein